MEDDFARRRVGWRDLSVRGKANVVFCGVVIVIALMTLFVPSADIKILEVALWIFIPWMTGNLVVDQIKLRRLKRESRQIEREYQELLRTRKGEQ